MAVFEFAAIKPSYSSRWSRASQVTPLKQWNPVCSNVSWPMCLDMCVSARGKRPLPDLSPFDLSYRRLRGHVGPDGSRQLLNRLLRILSAQKMNLWFSSPLFNELTWLILGWILFSRHVKVVTHPERYPNNRWICRSWSTEDDPSWLWASADFSSSVTCVVLSEMSQQLLDCHETWYIINSRMNFIRFQYFDLW